jgi:hypothetical protein
VVATQGGFYIPAADRLASQTDPIESFMGDSPKDLKGQRSSMEVQEAA